MRIAADSAGMIVVLENGCGDRGKAIAAMMAIYAWALHRCDRLDRGLRLASSNMHGGTQSANASSI
ncbi:hypothetical protein [Mesorhizobium sp. M1348]|uniref:hypothetical protein n=1 Tax=Mesorhizobium sp. M1348 TaxID=2957089 RepID=UPI0033363211